MGARMDSLRGDLVVVILATVPAFLLGKLVIRLHHGPVPIGVAWSVAIVGALSFCIAWGRQPLWLPARPLQVVVGFLMVFGGMLLLNR